MAGLLAYSVCFQRLPVSLGIDSGILLKPFKELTAAGTAAELHDFPYYPFPEPLPCKSMKID
ncbi:hypothetical protein TBC1_11739 [Lentimicrobium saccharophilum]|jgi:hypothetical protein|uniref:Uncharacterized protein n=1 Tax=Lentimicrobium saccharophilum TaxID=1678841 RepID=A0A0S7C1P6_9BACT|nr:hypothetical protein TBC1_11739 [Lentimicrobium saccharophilum]